jgi:hypothetical protein
MESYSKSINYFDQNFSIKIAASLAEKQAIYHFRYQVYTQQMRLLDNADHENQTLIDLLDNKNTILVYATDDIQNKVIGTLRINCRKNSNFRFEHLYSRQEFFPYFPIFVSHTSHFLVDHEYPTSKLTLEIFKFAYLKLLEKESLFDFVNCERNLVGLYQKLGYRIYKPIYSQRENGSIPMVLCLNDKKYLNKIGSPLLPILEKYIAGLSAEGSKKYILTDPEPAQLLERIIEENFSTHQRSYYSLATA